MPNRLSCRMSRVFVVLVLAVLGIACGPSMGMDASPDAPGVDSGPTGDGSDAPITTDGGGDVATDAPATSCNMVAVEDLAALGTFMGDTTRYTGNNMMAMDSTTIGLQPRPASPACPFLSTRQRVFRYTQRTAGALRLSTSNPGTTRGFDTVIVVADGSRACTSTTRSIACEDDDPLYGGDDRRVSTTLTTPVRAAGTTVFIGLGAFVGSTGRRLPAGEQGTFELTVQELTPQPAGMPCDTRGINSICAADATCVGNTTRFSTSGTCRANGSAPGARCATGDVCTTGLTCDTTEMPARCYSVVADGMPCERFANGARRCNPTSTCVSLVRGAVIGVCRANGSVTGASCDAMGACVAGLVCVPNPMGGTGTCLSSVGAGGACNSFDSRCPTGQSCRTSSYSGNAGTCTPDGTASRTACAMAGMCSGAMLTCQGAAPNQLCLGSGTAGQACNQDVACGTNTTCRLGQGAGGAGGIFDVYQGSCMTDGAEFGQCRVTGAACDAGLTCSNAADPANGVCRRDLMAGAACQYSFQTCGTGLECAHTAGMGPLVGTCVADGTAPGANCRGTGSPCDAGMTCSRLYTNPSAGEGVCQLAATTTCDPRYSTDRCPMGQTCRPSSLDTGTCAPTTNEVEPNDAVGGAPITAPVAVLGTLDAYDVDCVTVNVAAMGRLFARVSTPAGFCGGDIAPRTIRWRIDVYDPAGRIIGGDAASSGFFCPRIDGSDPAMRFPWAASLAAGAYSVCVHNTDATGRTFSTAAQYVLTVSTM